MPEEYLALVTAMKSLTQESAVTSEPDKGLPVAEDGWHTRPDKDSYGEIYLEFENNESLNGNNRKKNRVYEGSIDLYSRKRNGEGWPALIEQTLTEYCDDWWRLEYHGHETGTNLFHWEWVFNIEE